MIEAVVSIDPIHKGVSLFLSYTKVNKMNSLHHVKEHPKMSNFLQFESRSSKIFEVRAISDLRDLYGNKIQDFIFWLVIFFGNFYLVGERLWAIITYFNAAIFVSKFAWNSALKTVTRLQLLWASKWRDVQITSSFNLVTVRVVFPCYKKCSEFSSAFPITIFSSRDFIWVVKYLGFVWHQKFGSLLVLVKFAFGTKGFGQALHICESTKVVFVSILFNRCHS